MRRFLVLACTIEEGVRFLPVLVRCVSSSIMLSHALRSSTELVILFEKEETVLDFYSDRLRNVRPDESSLKGIFKKAFKLLKAGYERRRVHSGVVMYRASLREIASRTSRLFYCGVRGYTIQKALDKLSEEATFIVPLTNPSEESVKTVRELGATPLGCPPNYWPDQIITTLNIILDRVARI